MQFFSRNNDKKEDGQDSDAPPVRLASPVASIPPVVAPSVPHPTAPALPKASVATGPPTLSTDGTLDFPAIYQFARVVNTPFTAEQTLSMLEQLPAAMPLEMKRQTVQVTLTALGTAIGANRQSIVGDADQKRSTLQKYADAQGQKTDDYVVETQAQIAELQRQITEKEDQITVTKGKQERVRTLCDTETGRLESVLSFFEQETAALPEVTPVANLTLASAPTEEAEEAEEVDEEETSEASGLRVAA
ncbi:hypothetical protein [Armatimonas sp.]|uniref:hypothetical protein n=1 Tax=Armatimonas sp. TaxID=1872638 RepID=UPI003751349D